VSKKAATQPITPKTICEIAKMGFPSAPIIDFTPISIPFQNIHGILEVRCTTVGTKVLGCIQPIATKELIPDVLIGIRYSAAFDSGISC
jgi:hypothetical protein